MIHSKDLRVTADGVQPVSFAPSDETLAWQARYAVSDRKYLSLRNVLTIAGLATIAWLPIVLLIRLV